MAPLVRRSWALRGQTPLLYQRTRAHKKVSAIAALCIDTTDQSLCVCFRLHRDVSVDSTRAIDFLGHLLRHLRGPLIVIWDRLNAHKSLLTQEFILAKRPRLQAHFIPPYAPELNPVEQLWSYLKLNPLANHPIHTTQQLADVTRKHARSVQRRPALLQAFLDHTPLSFSFK